MRNIKISFVSILILVLAACAPSPAAIEGGEVQTLSDLPTYTPYPTLEPYPTYTSEPTYTPYPTYTSAPTLTPRVIIVTPTLSPTPEYTATSTNTPGPTNTPTPAPGVGDMFECGNYFSVQILPTPWMQKSVGDERASGQFLVLKLEIINNTTKTWDHMPEESYSVTGKVNDKTITFISNWDASFNTNYAYGEKFYTTDELPPGLSFITYVAFDVNPDGMDWKFVFSPSESFLSDPVCKVTIPVDEIIRY